MKSSLSVDILKDYIDIILKRCTFLYGINYSNLLRKRFDTIRYVSIKDLPDHVTMQYSMPTNSIEINRKFYRLIIEKERSSFIEHTIIHELLHAASRKKSNLSGFYEEGINEGITQMLADDIVGHSRNKYIDGYNENKLIAIIIRDVFGSSLVTDAYFKNSNILINAINSLSGDRNYYNDFSNKLSSLISINVYMCKREKLSGAIVDIKNRKVKNIIKDIIINLVIPKIKSLPINRRKSFISKIIYDISDDEKFKNNFVQVLSEYINLSDGSIIKEKSDIKKEDVSNNVHFDFIKLVEANKPLKNEVYIKPNGDVIMLSTGKKVTSNMECHLIYEKLFKLNHYDTFLDEKTLRDYIMNILKGLALKIDFDIVSLRRIMYCGLRRALMENGLYLLNDYSEFDNTRTIIPSYIHTDIKDITFDDMKKLVTKFKVRKKDEFNYSVYDRVTGKEIENSRLRKLAFFANNWLNNVGTVETKGEKVRFIEDAFSRKNKILYDRILSVMIDRIRNYDEFSVSQMERNLDAESIKVLRKIISNPTNFEWVYEFIINFSGENVMHEKKGESYLEKKHADYREAKANEYASRILA